VAALVVVAAIVATAVASTSYSLSPVWLGNPVTPSTISELYTGGQDQNAVTALSSDGSGTLAYINGAYELIVSSLDPSAGAWNPSTEAWSEGYSLTNGGGAAVISNSYGGPPDAPAVAVGMDAVGDAVVAWFTGTDVDYSYEIGGGGNPTWSSPVAVGFNDGSNIDDVQLAMNSSGDTAIVVTSSNPGDPVELARGAKVSGAFAFNAPVDIAQPGGGTAALPQVGIDGAGDVLTAWTGNGTPYASYEAASASTPTTAQPVSPGADAETQNGGVTLAMNASGQAAIAWSNGDSPSVIEEADADLSQLASGPQFDTATTVDPDPGETDTEFPTIALSDDGATALAWNSENSHVSDAAIRPVLDFGGAWPGNTSLEQNTNVCPSACANSNPTTAPQIAFEQGDNAVALWGGGDDGLYSVTSQGGSFATPTQASTIEYGSTSTYDTYTGTVTTSNSTTNWPYDNASPPALASDGVGDAVATWITTDSSNDQTVAVDDMDGAGTSFGIPTTGALNTPVTFTATSPWQWASPSTSWNFGDGGTGSTSGTGSSASVAHTYTAPGTYTVTGDTTDGNSAANDATGSITIPQNTQTISFPPPGAGTVGGSELLTATGGGSGNPVTFAVDPSTSPSDACSVSGTNDATVSFVHPGSCVIDARQAGNGDYSGATPTSQSIAVGKASQSISFPAPGGGMVGGSEPLSATGGNSGNPVTFAVDPSSNPSDACSISGTTVTFLNAGSCVIDANQAGNSDYSAATPVSHSMAVSPTATAPTNTAAAATPTTTTTTPTTTTAASTPPPVLGQSSDVAKTSGTVQVELPGTHTFVTVSASEQIPFGAVINATNGKVTATIALPGGGTSTATFWAGEFTLSQSSSGALTAKLVDGSSAGCPASEKASKHSSRLRTGHDLTLAKVTKKKPGAVVGSLWTNAKGSYTTSGKNGSAAVLGTEWLTRDQCDGTFFEVVKTSNDPHGEIRVTVLHPRKHTVFLKRGHSLLAPAPGFP
jgi:hypothetical protein